jgi:regulator of sirC expression with transglutaminase-like and TPR domain
VAARVGIEAVGLNAPGHFLVEVRLPDGPMIIDPFHGGRPLDAEEAFERIDELAGVHFPRNASWLDPASDREWISRLIRNLINVFAARRRQTDLAAMLELLSMVSPIRR